MVSRVSVSFSDEMNTSDVLDSWLQGLSEHRTNATATRMFLSKTCLDDKPSRRFTNLSSSPTLPPMSCPISPLTRSEMTDSPLSEFGDRIDAGQKSPRDSISPHIDGVGNSLRAHKKRLTPSKNLNLDVHIDYNDSESWRLRLIDLPALPVSPSISTPSSCGHHESSLLLRRNVIKSPTTTREYDERSPKRTISRAITDPTVLARSCVSEHHLSTPTENSTFETDYIDIISPTSVAMQWRAAQPRSDRGHQIDNEELPSETSCDRPCDRAARDFYFPSAEQTLGNINPHRQTPQLVPTVRFVSPERCSVTADVANTKRRTEIIKYPSESLVPFLNEEIWLSRPHLVHESPITSPKSEHGAKGLYSLDLICKSTTTPASMLRDCGMLIATHSHAASPSLPIPELTKYATETIDKYDDRLRLTSKVTAHTLQHSSQFDISTTKIGERFVDYRTNAPPLPPLPSPGAHDLSPPTVNHEPLGTTKKVSVSTNMLIHQAEYRALPKSTPDADPEHNVEHNKANSKAVRRTDVGPTNTATARSQFKTLSAPLPPVKSAVKQQRSSHHAFSSGSLPHDTDTSPRDIANCQVTARDITNGGVLPCHITSQQIHSRTIDGNPGSERNTITRQTSHHRGTSNQISPPYTVGPQNSPRHITCPHISSPKPVHHHSSSRHISNDQILPHKHHHQPSLTSTSTEPTVRFDMRLKALEKQNELLSAALMAVLETNGALQSPQHLGKTSPPRPTQWEGRVARRVAAATSGQAAATAALQHSHVGGAGLGISMGGEREVTEDGEGTGTKGRDVLMNCI